ncbi:helix-turn-helix transcriptional regulator [Salmonella enterica]|uniref:helix-turn-helix transcriptional regulator n=1 Tax=Citrobacter freundii TaxID=546 RepID=UPI001B37F34C|nr:helix-turn-helix transcriptional regulator [Citrobacter freundii]EHO4421614.1 helix-turn-helix transcriptional regulator [Salmonella enterica]HDX8776035.1 helix-turn-helix transcriptional regulator [Klebsiella oxytoca]EIL1869110.1 helix-turn-helix transcriptional regulator [Salmonella enterica]EKU4665044.1 helix-turn-helix transcriptional regulator [Citrobacter freundii]ELH4154191.1 helix-turn-helix transcriptional regulator [Salmonella enterica]
MVPKRLRIARDLADMSQEDLAAAAGASEETGSSRISRYEHGRHRPKFELVYQMAEELNVPEGYFYTLDDSFAEAMLKLYAGEVVQWKKSKLD